MEGNPHGSAHTSFGGFISSIPDRGARSAVLPAPRATSTACGRSGSGCTSARARPQRARVRTGVPNRIGHRLRGHDVAVERCHGRAEAADRAGRHVRPSPVDRRAGEHARRSARCSTTRRSEAARRSGSPTTTCRSSSDRSDAWTSTDTGNDTRRSLAKAAPSRAREEATATAENRPAQRAREAIRACPARAEVSPTGSELLASCATAAAPSPCARRRCRRSPRSTSSGRASTPFRADYKQALRELATDPKRHAARERARAARGRQGSVRAGPARQRAEAARGGDRVRGKGDSVPRLRRPRRPRPARARRSTSARPAPHARRRCGCSRPTRSRRSCSRGCSRTSRRSRASGRISASGLQSLNPGGVREGGAEDRGRRRRLQRDPRRPAWPPSRTAAKPATSLPTRSSSTPCRSCRARLARGRCASSAKRYLHSARGMTSAAAAAGRCRLRPIDERGACRASESSPRCSPRQSPIFTRPGHQRRRAVARLHHRQLRDGRAAARGSAVRARGARDGPQPLHRGGAARALRGRAERPARGTDAPRRRDRTAAGRRRRGRVRPHSSRSPQARARSPRSPSLHGRSRGSARAARAALDDLTALVGRDGGSFSPAVRLSSTRPWRRCPVRAPAARPRTSRRPGAPVAAPVTPDRKDFETSRWRTRTARGSRSPRRSPGRPTALAFFYTRCTNPEKCSLTVTRLARLATPSRRGRARRERRGNLL